MKLGIPFSVSKQRQPDWSYGNNVGGLNNPAINRAKVINQKNKQEGLILTSLSLGLARTCPRGIRVH